MATPATGRTRTAPRARLRARPRLAIVATHPIQYYAPVFKLLSARQRVDVRVFYGWEGGAKNEAFDPGFGHRIQWDIPLLEGYDHLFVANTSRNPGTHHFRGIASQSLNREMEKWEPDSVLVYGWNYQSHLAALRHFHGRVPILFRGDSTLIDEKPGLSLFLRRAWLTWIYRHVDMALFVGTENERYFRKHGIGTDRLIWAPHAIDNDRFADPDGSLQREANEWRQRLGISVSSRVLLFAGKLERRKAPEAVLREFLARNRDDEHLVIAGVGEMEGHLRAVADGHSRIHFIGFQNQSTMPTVYRLGDVFVMPSLWGETWGLAVNEAMASARPVVASDRVGCVADLVIPSRTGVVYSAESSSGLGEALALILDREHSLTKMGQEARHLISEWSFSAQAAGIENAALKFATASAFT